MRRSLLLASLLMLGSVPARADVFVPADPPAVSFRGCGGSAGGVEFTGRPTSKGWRVWLRSAGDAWGSPVRISTCPALAVGRDGTAALWTPRELVVRPPGGARRAAVSGAFWQVSVAPNGWIGALTLGGEGYDALELGALTVAPDGAVKRSRIASGKLVPGASVVAADGTMTAAWIEGRVLRTARAASGGPWVPGRSFTSAGYIDPGQFGLAGSPGGHSLLTWADDGAVQASYDGAPAERVAEAATAGSPRAAIDDSGGAVIAFGASPRSVMVLDRVAGGAWSAPRAIQGPLTPLEDNELTVDEPYEPREIVTRVMLAADGRVVVTWPTGARHTLGVAAAAGRLGGVWAAAAHLSSPVRDVADWSAGLAPDGAPRVEWRERDDQDHAVARAAVLVADAAAPAPDRTLPEVTATLPTHAPATRVGRVRVRVPVGCSEACDARLQVGRVRTARSLPALRTGAVVIVLDDLAARPGTRRFRVRLTVSDRAGNVVRRSSTLRVRVLRRPLRSFKVRPGHDFATCTRGGNRRLGELVNSIIDGLADGSLDSAGAIRRAWSRGVDAIERAFPDECLGDTDVRDHVFDVLDTPLTLAGYPEFYLDQ